MERMICIPVWQYELMLKTFDEAIKELEELKKERIFYDWLCKDKSKDYEVGLVQGYKYLQTVPAYDTESQLEIRRI